MKKKVWKFSNFSTADPSLASSHWLRPDLDAPGCCLFSDELILIVLNKLKSHKMLKDEGGKIDFSCLLANRRINRCTLVIIESLSQLKIRDSFGICLSWGFQNCHVDFLFFQFSAHLLWYWLDIDKLFTI